MRLLVSVKDRDEAALALAGGADIIDAKDPNAGALAAVSPGTFQAIRAAVARRRPVTAALGDAADADSIEQKAAIYARAGASLVKIGFAGVGSRLRVGRLIAAAMQGAAGHAGVIAVAYADADRVASLDPFAIVEAAARERAAGVLLDTADKHGPGLRGLMPLATLRSWVSAARDGGLLVAVAGKLTAGDLGYVSDAGADIAGVRGAACDYGRTSRIAVEKVSRLAHVMLGLALLATRQPVEQRDRPSNRADRQEKDERVDHHRSPAYKSASPTSVSQAKTPTKTMPTDSGRSLTNCPRTMAPPARFASSRNVSLNTARRLDPNSSIVQKRIDDAWCKG
jgi:uncharacterized protein (UPF0264 family)